METFTHDLRYAVRMLLKKPGFAAIVILALAIGIGANTAIFSVVNGILLRPLPYPDPDRIVMVWMNNTRMKVDQDIHSYPNYVDYRDQNQSFEQIAAYSGVSLNLTGSGEPERVIGSMSTANLFSVLGVQPMLGRAYTVEEEEPGRDQVVVLGYGLWQRRFGGDPGIVGQTISLSDVKREVIGVMPKSFRFPHKDAELWAPLAVTPNRRSARTAFSFYAIGRLKRDVSLEQARTDMSSIADQLQQQYPDLEGFGANLVPLHEQVVGKTRLALLVLLGMVVFVLLIACANVANLLLARAAVREREIAIRMALGAGRLRLIRQLLTESSLLGLLGGAAGLLIAAWGLKALIALSPEDTPRLDQISIDRRVLVFTLAVSLLTGLLFGLVPALQASKSDLNESLKEGGRSSTGGLRGRRIRNVLVAFEIASSLVLLICAGLMIKSFMRLREVSLGFKPDRLMTMNLQLSRSRYQGRQGHDFYQKLIQRVEALPGVESAAAITDIFIDALPNSGMFTVEGRPATPAAEQIEAPLDFMTPGYFRTMGIPLLLGRDIEERDNIDAPPVVVINNTFAQRFWPGEDPLGKRFKFGGPDSDAPWLSIVGVVADMRRTGYDAEVRCEAFLPYSQRSFIGFMILTVRARTDPKNIIAAVRDEVWAIDPNQPISHIRTMDQTLDEMISQRRLNMVLFGIFAATAMMLAAVGVYGVISYSVTQREHEMGIRMALGARGPDVIKLVIVQGLRLTLAGVVLGLIGALLLTRVMASLLYLVSATDTWTFAVIPLLLTGVALIASFIPARRATRVDPMVALRYE
ncbi:MAG TPA: ABC transporter permease [Blastocatellia bacterium]|nr:ABC transporter permease [Blastocatellia bacterium]